MALDWVNFINKAYINVTAPEIQVFKLDKVETRVDSLYGEEVSSRIYLPPFTMRAFHLDNPWQQVLGPFAYTEQEDNILFILNFEDMVQKIRNLKEGNISNIYITYDGDSTPYAYKNGDSFVLKVGDSLYSNFDLTNTSYNTTKKLKSEIDNLTAFSATFSGDNDTSTDLVDFNLSSFKGAQLHVFSEDKTYDNITDVIEAGDLILTNKWRLYEVMNNNPSGNFAWDWVTFTLSCRLARIDQANLPKEYEEQIREHQYDINQKTDIEGA